MSYSPSDTIKDPEVYRELQVIATELEQLRYMKIQYRAPDKPREGLFYICDGVSWNPLGDGIKRPVWFDQISMTWKAF